MALELNYNFFNEKNQFLLNGINEDHLKNLFHGDKGKLLNKLNN